jgi:hypothetical protein
LAERQSALSSKVAKIARDLIDNYYLMTNMDAEQQGIESHWLLDIPYYRFHHGDSQAEVYFNLL